MLLDYCLQQAKALGYGAICIEGNIHFYEKSGFTYAKNYHLRYHDLPEEANTSFFLCIELIPNYLKNIKGAYITPKGYFIDKKEVEIFDQQFPYKEKLKLPGQLFD